MADEKIELTKKEFEELYTIKEEGEQALPASTSKEETKEDTVLIESEQVYDTALESELNWNEENGI